MRMGLQPRPKRFGSATAALLDGKLEPPCLHFQTGAWERDNFANNNPLT